MSEVSVYEVSSSVERAVSKLVEKLCNQNIHAIIFSTIEDRLSSLDTALWTLGKDSFLPHDFADSDTAEHSPILLTSDITLAKKFFDTAILLDADFIEEFFESKKKIAFFIHKDNPEIESSMKKIGSIQHKIWTETNSGKWVEKSSL